MPETAALATFVLVPFLAGFALITCFDLPSRRWHVTMLVTISWTAGFALWTLFHAAAAVFYLPLYAPGWALVLCALVGLLILVTSFIQSHFPDFRGMIAVLILAGILAALAGVAGTWDFSLSDPARHLAIIQKLLYYESNALDEVYISSTNDPLTTRRLNYSYNAMLSLYAACTLLWGAEPVLFVQWFPAAVLPLVIMSLYALAGLFARNRLLSFFIVIFFAAWYLSAVQQSSFWGYLISPANVGYICWIGIVLLVLDMMHRPQTPGRYFLAGVLAAVPVLIHLQTALFSASFLLVAGLYQALLKKRFGFLFSTSVLVLTGVCLLSLKLHLFIARFAGIGILSESYFAHTILNIGPLVMTNPFRGEVFTIAVFGLFAAALMRRAVKASSFTGEAVFTAWWLLLAMLVLLPPAATLVQRLFSFIMLNRIVEVLLITGPLLVIIRFRHLIRCRHITAPWRVTSEALCALGAVLSVPFQAVFPHMIVSWWVVLFLLAGMFLAVHRLSRWHHAAPVLILPRLFRLLNTLPARGYAAGLILILLPAILLPGSPLNPGTVDAYFADNALERGPSLRQARKSDAFQQLLSRIPENASLLTDPMTIDLVPALKSVRTVSSVKGSSAYGNQVREWAFRLFALETSDRVVLTTLNLLKADYLLLSPYTSKLHDYRFSAFSSVFQPIEQAMIPEFGMLENPWRLYRINYTALEDRLAKTAGSEPEIGGVPGHSDIPSRKTWDAAHLADPPTGTVRVVHELFPPAAVFTVVLPLESTTKDRECIITITTAFDPDEELWVAIKQIFTEPEIDAQHQSVALYALQELSENKVHVYIPSGADCLLLYLQGRNQVTGQHISLNPVNETE